jgi:chromate transporter
MAGSVCCFVGRICAVLRRCRIRHISVSDVDDEPVCSFRCSRSNSSGSGFRGSRFVAIASSLCEFRRMDTNGRIGRRLHRFVQLLRAAHTSSFHRRRGGLALAGKRDEVNVFLLYVVLLKATITAFSGPSSLPVVRDELVVNRHVLTDEQLNAAVVVGRTTPGPNGLYVVSVGFFVAGIPGAVAGWLAMITPAFLVIPIVHFLGQRADHPAVRRVLSSVILASVGLILVAMLPLGRSSVSGPVLLAVAAGGFAALAFFRVNTFWVVLGSAVVAMLCSFAGVQI